ncbi:MAG TPA: hypothetical protein VFZ78_12060 [Flavisolibacter sp.]
MKRHLLLSLGLMSALLYFVSCQKESSFEVGQLATGVLQDSVGDCFPSTVSGTFKTGEALGSGSTVTISVDVSQSGAYTIYTDTINGYYFKGSGNFPSTGVQSVTLQAFGTPQSVQVDNFTVFFNNTYCGFAVTVTAGGGTIPVTSNDYLPLAQGNWWSYDDGAGGDSIKTVVNGTATLDGNTYVRAISSDDLGPYDTAFYRKNSSNGFYYIYQTTDDLQGIGFNFNTAGLDVLFLKNTLTTGEVFNSDHAGTLSGVPATLRFNNTVINSNLSMTVNGKNFSNVYHIETKIQFGAGGIYQDVPTMPVFTLYFAKGIGLIKSIDFAESHIRNWQIF